MKLPMLLGALLLSASPVIAADFVYLKCEVTIESTEFNWKLVKQISKSEEDDVIHYKIDFKKETVFDSTEPEVANKFQTDLNTREIAWKTAKTNGSIYGEDTTHLQYETPGEVVGTIYLTDRDHRIENSGILSGSCEASDAETYEASK